MKIIECVPNVSEGRDQKTLDAIAASVEEVEGVELLDVDPGAETNRTVFTFVGGPDAVAEAAFRFTATATRLIDMRHHKGAHARMGAVDVVPFVPVGGGATMDDCVALARAVGQRIGEELEIPIYLYEAAATRPERESLAEIRRGEYEALETKLADPEWAPDFGPARFHARAGATVVGARPFLIAYNVDLNTPERKKAHDIALDIREQGRAQRGPDGKFLRDAEGQKIRKPGRFQNVRAVGWFIPEFGRAQVSINLTNFHVSPPHAVFDAICEEATRRGMRVTGSEIVGLVPREALLEAGRHYLRAQGKSPAVPEPDLVHMARVTLGLDDVKPFEPEETVIEYRLARRARGLTALSVVDFADELSRDTPAPGGGSVAALVGSLGAGLASMVAALTHGSKGQGEEQQARLAEIGEQAQQLKDRLLHAVNEDTEAFDAIMAARRMPRKSDEQQQARNEAILAATRRAIEVPLGVVRTARDLALLAGQVVEVGMEAAASDCGVAGWCARTAAEAAGLNVRINLPGLPDEPERRRLAGELDELLDATREAARGTVERAEEIVARG
jgi:glutamate formiminotransferase/formiminotetrahydrofolate cyclodeaminase